MRADSHCLLLRPAAPGAPAPDNHLNSQVRQSRHLPPYGPDGAAESPSLGYVSDHIGLRARLSLTQPEQFCRWFGVNVDIEPYVGGRFGVPEGMFSIDQ